MIAILLSVFLSAAPHWDSDAGVCWGVFPTGTALSSTTDGQMSVCKSTAAQDCLFVNADTGAFTCTPPATDAAPDSCSIKGRDAYVLATGGNVNAAGLGVSGGIGVEGWTGITQANCAGDNVSVNVFTLSGTTTTTCTEGAGWTCITDNNTCAAGLVTCLAAAAGVTAYRSTNNVYLIPSSGTLGVSVLASDATCATIVNSAHGPIKAMGSMINAALRSYVPTGTTQTVDWSLANVQFLDLESASGNVTLTWSNAQITGVYTLIIQQDGGGAFRTVTFPANTYFAGGTAPYTLTVTATNDAIDVVTMVCTTTAVCYATVSQDHK